MVFSMVGCGHSLIRRSLPWRHQVRQMVRYPHTELGYGGDEGDIVMARLGLQLTRHCGISLGDLSALARLQSFPPRKASLPALRPCYSDSSNHCRGRARPEPKGQAGAADIKG